MKTIQFLSIFLFLSVFSLVVQAQDNFTVKGNIKDSASAEGMGYATVEVKETGQKVVADGNGDFSINLPGGKYTLVITTLGYKPYTRKINLSSDLTIAVPLHSEDEEIQEVEIKDKKVSNRVTDTKISTQEVNIQQIKKLPALFGEVDVIKNIQMLPGIQVAGEGNTGLYVRGGSSDQNLVLIDDAPVYNASHLLGIFSIFNADVLKSAEIYKGGIPAEYGGRLSSLVDIRTKEGNMQKLKGSGGLGLIMSRLALEGPIKKDKASFIVSARRSYADMFLKLSPNKDQRSNILYFYDLNTKISYNINAKNKLYISAYYGRDVLKLTKQFGMDWGNLNGSIRWNHSFNDNFYSNTIITMSKFDYKLTLQQDIQKFDFKTGVKEVAAKQNFNWIANDKNDILVGASITYRSYDPGQFIPGSNSLFKAFVIDKYHSVDEALYISNKQKITPRLTLDYGLRYSIFTNIGKGSVYKYKGGLSEENIYDTATYKSFAPIKTYGGLEPRLSGRYMLSDNSSIKATYNRMYQYIHLMANSTSPLPFNMWIPSTPYISPQKADQVAGGYFRNFQENKFEASVEVYYKYMKNAVDFKDNSQLLLNAHPETEIRRGNAWSYGLELFLRKNKGKTTGWISYTWSKTQKKIPGVNDGRVYYADYDRRNNLNVVVSHEVNKKWNISGNFVYGSGRPFTLPAARWQFDYTFPAYYTQRNGYRMPPYHRMDLAVTYNLEPATLLTNSKRLWEFSITGSLYNVYGRKNPFTIYTREKENHPGEKEVVMIYLFRWLPSVTLNFQF